MKPSAQTASHWNPLPSFLYVICSLYLWLPYIPIVWSSIEINQPTKITRCDANIAGLNSGSIFAVGFLFRQVVGRNGLVISRKRLKYLWCRKNLSPLNKLRHKSLPLNTTSVCELNFCSTPSYGLKPLDMYSAKCCFI